MSGNIDERTFTMDERYLLVRGSCVVTLHVLIYSKYVEFNDIILCLQREGRSVPFVSRVTRQGPVPELC